MPKTMQTLKRNPPARPTGSGFESVGSILERLLASRGCWSELRRAAPRSDKTGRVEARELPHTLNANEHTASFKVAR